MPDAAFLSEEADKRRQPPLSREKRALLDLHQTIGSRFEAACEDAVRLTALDQTLARDNQPRRQRGDIDGCKYADLVRDI